MAPGHTLHTTNLESADSLIHFHAVSLVRSHSNDGKAWAFIVSFVMYREQFLILRILINRCDKFQLLMVNEKQTDRMTRNVIFAIFYTICSVRSAISISKFKFSYSVEFSDINHLF